MNEYSSVSSEAEWDQAQKGSGACVAQLARLAGGRCRWCGAGCGLPCITRLPWPTRARRRPSFPSSFPGNRVAGTINATGLLAAKHDMPIASVGEGGQVAQVLVNAGTG
jgi:hypothetical protein